MRNGLDMVPCSRDVKVDDNRTIARWALCAIVDSVGDPRRPQGWHALTVTPSFTRRNHRLRLSNLRLCALPENHHFLTTETCFRGSAVLGCGLACSVVGFGAPLVGIRVVPFFVDMTSATANHHKRSTSEPISQSQTSLSLIRDEVI